MATSVEPQINGNQDHILRPRAVKPMNPEVFRTQVEDGFFQTNGHTPNGISTGQTRFDERI
jgi:hypothetical protein